MLRLFILATIISRLSAFYVKNSTGRLIQNDWATLEAKTTLRFFNPTTFQEDGSASAIWEGQGHDILCRVEDDLTVEVGFPPGLDPSLPVKVVTHGFSDGATEFVPFIQAYLNRYNRAVNVILVDWRDLAFPLQFNDWDSFAYDSAARNAIDVGEYLGHCLAGLAGGAGLPGAQFHLVGHSLGAHLVGKAGRIFRTFRSEPVGRVSGLDPAGPRFVDGPIEWALPELHANRLSVDSAAFVDVVHTDGSLTPAVVWIIPRAGDLHAMGHMDFYPQGGSAQPGCGFLGPDALPGGICSHCRSYHYFLHSIREPDLFPSSECRNEEACSHFEVVSEDVTAYMGESAQEYFTGERKLFYLEIHDTHWNNYEHN